MSRRGRGTEEIAAEKPGRIEPFRGNLLRPLLAGVTFQLSRQGDAKLKSALPSAKMGGNPR
jgi:hypothetical protein